MNLAPFVFGAAVGALFSSAGVLWLYERSVIHFRRTEELIARTIVGGSKAEAVVHCEQCDWERLRESLPGIVRVECFDTILFSSKNLECAIVYNDGRCAHADVFYSDGPAEIVTDCAVRI